MNVTRSAGSALALVLALLSLTWADAADPRTADQVPVIFDTDIVSYIDDTFALALALSSPELDIRGITTVAGHTENRAWMVCRLLTMVERKNIPVAFGATPQPDKKIEGMYQYRNHPAVIYNR